MPDQVSAAGSKPLAAALLIMFAGPPIGRSAATAWEAAGIGVLMLGAGSSTRSDFLDCYVLGGAQSTIAALIVVCNIHRFGWINLQRWLLVTLFLSIIPAIVFHFANSSGRKSDLFFITFENELAYFATTTFLASLALRILIISLGLMRKPQ
jgi:hypothetical protein